MLLNPTAVEKFKRKKGKNKRWELQKNKGERERERCRQTKSQKWVDGLIRVFGVCRRWQEVEE